MSQFNPELVLEDRMRAAFGCVLDMFDGDVGKTKRYLSDMYENFSTTIEPYLDCYLAEMDSSMR